jgi:hypothetical protein
MVRRAVLRAESIEEVFGVFGSPMNVKSGWAAISRLPIRKFAVMELSASLRL